MAGFEAECHHKLTKFWGCVARPIACIYSICRWLPDGCKPLRQLQELSVLTGRFSKVRLPTAVTDLVSRFPS